MIRRPPRSTLSSSSAASDVYKRQGINAEYGGISSGMSELAAGQLAAWEADEVRAAVAGSVVLLDDEFMELVQHGPGLAKLMQLGAWTVLRLGDLHEGFGVGCDLSPIVHPAHLVLLTTDLSQPELYALPIKLADCELRVTIFHAHPISRDAERAALDVIAAAHVLRPVSYTHLRAHETPEHLVCRLLLEKKKHTTGFNYRILVLANLQKNISDYYQKQQ
eukprot:TRINITY_DN57729_c0_g1_i1.p1 TRINITY_DN57729_c0_g1~~TRINITY_DN57729_c0_g1_i1.p1  ORF type:complete len:220 (+),score=49.77 TRINITY_DN57729_c0_g1_i1:64-723(+)